MDKKLYKLMDWPQIEEIVYSECAYPHEYLGRHKAGKKYLIQFFMPGAQKVSIVTKNGETIDMEMADEEGFFAALMDKKEDYAYYVYDGDQMKSYEDPYNFEPLITPEDETKFIAGIHYTIYEKLGAHITEIDGVKGTYFAVWAPNAMRVSVVGDFNNWDGRVYQMRKLDQSGIFEIFLPGVGEGALYKYEIKAKNGMVFLKSDPYASAAQLRPDNASVVADLEGFAWEDEKFISERETFQNGNVPMSVYEMYLGSFLDPKGGQSYANYREIAPKVIEYVKKMGYTHVELMPVMEHPLDNSWGYQVIGYYAPTSRYGSPKDFKYFVNELHKAGIGVILDWVPAHFPKDTHGLCGFDGTCLYEHQDPRQGVHPHWGTLIYNYGRPEVSNYLIANGLYWVEQFHADGIRMDAVASMLYLDYGRQDGAWVANMYGGNENLEAIEMIKHFNSVLKKRNPGVLSVAEESTAFPLITGALEDGGLGFDLKWNMGFMNDYLRYIQLDPYFRSHHHGELTFSMIYAYSEKFMLVFSHDEVVHGKATLIGKMPGTREDKFSGLKLSLAYMMTHPGKKLLFMGQELGEFDEWNEERRIQWNLEEVPEHAGVQKLYQTLNSLYRSEKALYELDDQPEGFEWLNAISGNDCYITYRRNAASKDDFLVVVANFAGKAQTIRTGVPFEGKYTEILNTDDTAFAGSGVVNPKTLAGEDVEWDGKEVSIAVEMAPLSLSILRFEPYTEEELKAVIEKRVLRKMEAVPKLVKKAKPSENGKEGTTKKTVTTKTATTKTAANKTATTKTAANKTEATKTAATKTATTKNVAKKTAAQKKTGKK